MRRWARVLIPVTGAAVGLLLTATGATAHECYIGNRSDNGDAGASTSAVWETVTIETIMTDVIGLPPDLGSCVLGKWRAAGLPAQFTFRTDKTIGDSSHNPNLANGKGLEHAAEVYGPSIEQFIGECSAP